MATLIDIGFLSNFTAVFLFLLVFSILYGVLTKVDFFKLGAKSKGLNAIIAITVALITLMSGNVQAMISTMVPWFFVLFLFIILMLISAMIFGASNEDIAKVVKKQEVWVWIVILGVIILLFSLGQSFGQSLLNETNDGTGTDNTVTVENAVDNTGTDNTAETTNSGDFESNLVRTLFHPKILGLLMIGLIGLLATAFITRQDI